MEMLRVLSALVSSGENSGGDSSTLRLGGGDKVKDTLNFSLGGDNLDSVADWAITISDQQGAALRHITEEGLWAQPTYAWQGLGDNRRVLPDGSYSAKLALEYVNGRIAVSDPVAVLSGAIDPFRLHTFLLGQWMILKYRPSADST